MGSPNLSFEGDRAAPPDVPSRAPCRGARYIGRSEPAGHGPVAGKLRCYGFQSGCRARDRGQNRVHGREDSEQVVFAAAQFPAMPACPTLGAHDGFFGVGRGGRQGLVRQPRSINARWAGLPPASSGPRQCGNEHEVVPSGRRKLRPDHPFHRPFPASLHRPSRPRGTRRGKRRYKKKKTPTRVGMVGTTGRNGPGGAVAAAVLEGPNGEKRRTHYENMTTVVRRLSEKSCRRTPWRPGFCFIRRDGRRVSSPGAVGAGWPGDGGIAVDSPMTGAPRRSSRSGRRGARVGCCRDGDGR